MAANRMQDKVAIVTGAAPRGEGLGNGMACAMMFAAEGAKVVLVNRKREKADALAEKIGPVDILANVAGAITRGDALDTSDEDWASMMNINVGGTFYMSRAAIPAMRRAGGGSIINLGSTVGLTGCSGLVAYCASKGAVVNMTRAMALDHAQEKIRVNSVNPGAVDTPMLVSGHKNKTAKQVLDANRADIPQGWLPTPQDIANTIAFLASDLSNHITGAAVSVDGGYTAR